MFNFTIGYWLRSAIPVEGTLGWALWLLSLESIWRQGDRRIRVRFFGLTVSLEAIDTRMHGNTQKREIKATIPGNLNANGKQIEEKIAPEFAVWAQKIHEKGIKLVVKSKEIYDLEDNSFTLRSTQASGLVIDIGTTLAFGGPEDAFYVRVTGYRAIEDDVTKFFGKVITL